MADLKSKKLIYLKAFLFFMLFVLSTGLIINELPSWRIAVLLAIAIWSSARLYYFMFYVIEKYVDSQFKFASVYSFIKYLLSKKNK